VRGTGAGSWGGDAARGQSFLYALVVARAGRVSIPIPISIAISQGEGCWGLLVRRSPAWGVQG
jgi:hypothetical protein